MPVIQPGKGCTSPWPVAFMFWALGVGRQRAVQKEKQSVSLHGRDWWTGATVRTDIQFSSFFLICNSFTLLPTCLYIFFLKHYSPVFLVFGELREKFELQPEEADHKIQLTFSA